MARAKSSDVGAKAKKVPVADPHGTMSGRVIIGQDVGLAYIERGAGPPIVLIPHWTFTKETFNQQINALSGRHRVISYDPRGQGASSFSRDGNDYITHAHDLDTMLETIGVANPILVGWGTGALTAWGYVRLKGTEAIAGLAVIDMPPKPLSPHDGDWREGTIDEVAAIHTLFLRDARGVEAYLRRMIETSMVERALQPEELRAMLDHCLLTSTIVAAQLFANAMFADLTNTAIAVARARPVLFFLGTAHAREAVELIERQMPEARHVTFGGRMMFWEHHAAFNHVMLEFADACRSMPAAPETGISISM